eukprot:CAMPEP_0184337332 /NCGR_PEP_ID=MMETSP1089-20130417/5715_1 /TAXON_ID=38269 ORGANISM="Gloeochaete wittrockiana, Strain SAG46.84" /NCGR_SAMPLE_ID=MMETSP1089 /ASSEMBLY_ACC=CAM_ASM_000445 /LENGTH=445 /DNA_ID=CAMNT_0026662971 /DNA_START=23 /DNA_END=1361 /DNA_ORIENTATION=-
MIRRAQRALPRLTLGLRVFDASSHARMSSSAQTSLSDVRVRPSMAIRPPLPEDSIVGLCGGTPPAPYFMDRSEKRTVAEDIYGLLRIIVVNRPEALNAINLDMVQVITTKIKEYDQSTLPSLLGIRGAGGRAFCAGGDVKGLALAAKQDPMLAPQFFQAEYAMNYLIASVSKRKPILAFMDGITMGGGAGLSIHARYRIATEKTVFAMPETAIGFFPDIGATFFLTHTLPSFQLGLYLGLTGSRLKGSEAKRVGLATHYVPSRRLEHLQHRIGALSDVNNLQVLESALCEFEDPIDTMELDEKIIGINRCFVVDSQERESSKVLMGIMDRLAQENSEWADQTMLLLRKMSPTSLAVTMRALLRGSKLSLKECLAMEYRIAVHMSTSKSDMWEGIRSVLIDKDGKASWSPRLIENVSETDVQRFFAPISSIYPELQFPPSLQKASL